ncbi:bifunctional polysaccharide deacetylase/glycosyltransferase family 2 protein [Actinomadura sp. HBU206391]|uniref:bifunctional polysaccharide deacetylase/glycosyltransferase family 2 protein n=1 Tax=Actinomadura sp. HBU206391 TaxID=2731692 RepID=UPI00290581BE|nr:bifunctional polysaccharide deacetylase/glycosyltransferase family 2 protein [Actinomadura sp. HBU206391]
MKGTGRPPAAVANGGPVLNLTGSAPQSAGARPGKIALTFDDGPDPKWTPQLLDVLRRHNAKATFFVVGAHVAEHPGLTRRVRREGHELGVHTYTHIDMASAAEWRQRVELDLTQRVLAGTIGVHTRLMRMPYSATPAAMTGSQWQAAQQIGGQGYLVVLADRDTEDWRRPGTDAIVAAATDGPRGRGAVVMLHDSGGDRTQTVAAVDRLLTLYSKRGYQFTTLTEALGSPAAEIRASAPERVIGNALVTAQWASSRLVGALTFLFGIAAVLTALRLATLLWLARAHVRQMRRRRRRQKRGWARLAPPPVSVIVPAYNEEAGIEATVRSLLDTDYPAPMEIIVVDDGSTDQTAWIVDNLRLSNVRLICQDNGGKPSALNTGIANARYDVLVLVDGDTVFQRDTIGNLVRPLANARVGAVSGNTKVANRGRILGRWQHIEYVIGFNLDRRMFDVLQCMPTVPGAIGAFRREALMSVGGVSNDTLAEDTDLTMAICRAGWRVEYEESALAWTEAPSSVRQLWRQRYRWCYGTLQAMWKHRRSVVERGPFGRRCLSYLVVFQVALPLFAPAVDVFALYGLVFLDPMDMAASWLVFMIAQAVAGAYALRLDGERLRTLWTLPLQQVVYRQLMYLVVIQSLVTALLGTRLRWQVIRRTGTFSSTPPAEPVPARSLP